MSEIDKARAQIEKMKKRMKELSPTMGGENPATTMREENPATTMGEEPFSRSTQVW